MKLTNRITAITRYPLDKDAAEEFARTDLEFAKAMACIYGWPQQKVIGHESTSFLIPDAFECRQRWTAAVRVLRQLGVR